MIVHGTLKRVRTVDCCLSSVVTYVCTVTVTEAPLDIKRRRRILHMLASYWPWIIDHDQFENAAKKPMGLFKACSSGAYTGTSEATVVAPT